MKPGFTFNKGIYNIDNNLKTLFLKKLLEKVNLEKYRIFEYYKIKEKYIVFKKVFKALYKEEKIIAVKIMEPNDNELNAIKE